MHQLLLVSPSLSCPKAIFISLLKSTYLSLFSLSLVFTQWSLGKANSLIGWFLLFLLIVTQCDLLAEIMGFVCITKFQRIFASYSLGRIAVCAYTIW